MTLRQMIQEETEPKVQYTRAQVAAGYTIVAVLGVAGSILITMVVALYGGVLVGIAVQCFRAGYAVIG